MARSEWGSRVLQLGGGKALALVMSREKKGESLNPSKEESQSKEITSLELEEPVN